MYTCIYKFQECETYGGGADNCFLFPLPPPHSTGYRCSNRHSFIQTCGNFYFCNFQEPTSSVAPKVTGSRLQEKTLDFGQAGTVLCLSQGYPVPNIRRVSIIAERLSVCCDCCV